MFINGPDPIRSRPTGAAAALRYSGEAKCYQHLARLTTTCKPKRTAHIMAKKKTITGSLSRMAQEDLDEAGTILGEACAILDSQLMDLGSSVAYGAHRLLTASLEHLDGVLKKATEDDLEAISCDLSCALAVLDAFLSGEKTGDPSYVPVWGAYRLASIAKASIDARSLRVVAGEAAEVAT